MQKDIVCPQQLLEFVNRRNISPTVYNQYLTRGINTLPGGNVLTNCSISCYIFKMRHAFETRV